MDAATRRLLRYGLSGVVAVFAALFFVQTRDPMILVFGLLAAAVLSMLLSGKSWHAQPPAVRVRCRACGALNLEDAKYCSQCGGSI